MKITHEIIVETVKQLVMDAACNLDPDMVRFLQLAKQKETAPLAKTILDEILQNQDIARAERIPMCQDTGVSVFFIELGSQVRLDFDLYAAIQEGTRQGYKEGLLRKSIVKHPIDRVNTKDNTPAIIHLTLANHNQIKIQFAPKGAGSENLSRMKMMTPAETTDDVVAFVKETIAIAGGKACPPLIIGVGIGGNFETAPLLAKKAIFRHLDDEAEHPTDRELERRILQEVNQMSIGPMGLGGVTTALAVKVNSYPCHIASFPIAVNLQCHAARHKEAVLEGDVE